MARFIATGAAAACATGAALTAFGATGSTLAIAGCAIGLGGAGGLGGLAFFFSSCTATEIARRCSSRFCATATRPTARPTWSPTEMMTVGNRNDYSPLC